MARRRSSDPARAESDAILAEIEKRIEKEYAQAQVELQAKLDDYMRRFRKKDATWRRWVAEGKKTEEEYKKWRMGQIIMGERWEEMKDTLAEDLVNVHRIAEGVVNGSMPDVYAINHNYGTYCIEHGSLIDTSYTLYNREAVERLLRDNPTLYGAPGRKVSQAIRDGLLKRWDKQQIQSVMLQGILQGESITNMSKRLHSVTQGDKGAAIRNARTMCTGVEAAGRLDSFKRAERMGIKNKKVWLANLDSRTRHWHRQLDGVAIPHDEPFENDFGKIMFPGDPEANGSNIYNCRCTLNTQIQGREIDYSDLRGRYTKKLGDMTYEEWKAEKKSTSNPIDAQEKIGEAIRASYIRRYRRG